MSVGEKGNGGPLPPTTVTSGKTPVNPKPRGPGNPVSQTATGRRSSLTGNETPSSQVATHAPVNLKRGNVIERAQEFVGEMRARQHDGIPFLMADANAGYPCAQASNAPAAARPSGRAAPRRT
jgi:hypothetical protein